jgi:hypothetical protein
MLLAFHFFLNRAQSIEGLWKQLNEVAAAIQFFPIGSRPDVSKTTYRRKPGEPDLSILVDPNPDRVEHYIHPITEEHLRVYGPELLVRLFSNLCIRLDADLARTFPDTGYFIVTPPELNGQLAFIDWYQYLSPKLVSRWGLEYLRRGPFHRVEIYPNGGCGIWLAASPEPPLGRTKAAEYLGITLPKLYGRNPQTRENIEIPWD